jgi:hypothetical protein
VKILTFCLALLLMTCTLAFGQHYKVLYSFQGPKVGDGAYSNATLVHDNDGNLYGTTVAGGLSGCNPYGSCGTAFELSPNPDGSWAETVLYEFCSNRVNGQCVDGQMPEGGLVMDSVGNLYGTTSEGGSNLCPGGQVGCGTVFELSQSTGGSWTETVLYDFCDQIVNNACLDGSAPVQGSLAIDATGNLFGATQTGGSGQSATVTGGTVFELSPILGSFTETVIYNFCVGGTNQVCPSGNWPSSGLTFDASGNLYGTTYTGGNAKSQAGGVIYKLAPTAGGWDEAVLYGLA